MARVVPKSGKCIRGVIAERIRRNRGRGRGGVRNRSSTRRDRPNRRNRSTPRIRNLPRHISYIKPRAKTNNQGYYMVSFNCGRRSFPTLAEVILFIFNIIIFLIFYLGGGCFGQIPIWRMYFMRS
jgi:hypothetical protein